MIKPKKFIEEIDFKETCEDKISWHLKLDNNENVYGISDLAHSTLKNVSKEELGFYPNPEKLIDKLSLTYELNKENILLTNGAQDALKLCFDTYLETNDEILTYDYEYFDLILYAKNNGAVIKKIEYDEKFVINSEKIIESISDKTKILYVSTPDEYTGSIIKPSFIEQIAQKFPNILIIADCSYINFDEETVFEDYIDKAKKLDNVVIIKSFSKDYALAGLRIAFIAASENIIKNLKKIILPNNVNSVAINCAISALDDKNRINEIKELNSKAKEELYEGLKALGYKPYESHGNFILCDFGKYCKYYYEKLKKNGVIVKNFSEDSLFNSCLRIGVPKTSGVKYILKLLKVKDMLIFDIDGVIFDIINSHVVAIAETFKYFTGQEADKSEILRLKNLGGMSCDWDVALHLLKNSGYDIQMPELISVFQNFFFNPAYKTENKKYLIDEEKLLIPKETFEKITEKYDLVIFTGRLKDEINYSFNKFGIGKYFYHFVFGDDLPKNMLKPNPYGILKILDICPHKSIRYLGCGVDGIIAANMAKIETIGVVSPDSDFNSTVNSFKHLGAKYILDDINLIYEFLTDILPE